MQETDPLIRTKLHLPFTRNDLVNRQRLYQQILKGLQCPLILITAPAGFGKTTLVAEYITSCGLRVAWLSLDKEDNQIERFLSYLVAALQSAEYTIGRDAAQILMSARQAPVEVVVTSLINDLDIAGVELVLVLDDYQSINNHGVHGAIAYLLEHCPKTFHLVIATRSDPPLPLSRFRARGQLFELRAEDLRFTETETDSFLNEVMGLHLDPGSVAALEKRTEGWIAGLQMAALSMQYRNDVDGFIESFSGTNRFILDYLVEEVLSNQPPEIQHFLLYTSILERVNAPLCDAITEIREWKVGGNASAKISFFNSQSVLEYLEMANLFLLPLDDERQWYRYHQLFADLLRAQLQKSIGVQGVEVLHLRAANWYAENGSPLEAIYHASLASDDEMVEQLIEINYMEMMNRGEMSWVRFWMGKLSKDLVYRRPWLCLYEAMNHSWFGRLDEANLLLGEAEKHLHDETSGDISVPNTQAMLGYHDYVKSRVTAMQGDTRQAIELCKKARENIPGDNLGLQIDVSITLGYEYFLYGDFVNAEKILREMIRSGYNVRAINNPVAGYAVLARLYVYQGGLYEAYNLLKKAEQLIPEVSGQFLGAIGLIDVGIAALLCEWNDNEAALARLKQSLDFLPYWGKTDDLCLAYTTLWRIHIAQGKRTEAAGAIEKASQLIHAGGIFSEARGVVESTQVRSWLMEGDKLSLERWVASLDKRLGSQGSYQYENELTYMARARVYISQDNPGESLRLLSGLEEIARSGGRIGRLIEIMILTALALQMMGENQQAVTILTKCLALAEPEGYLRIFLDEGQLMRNLLTQWLAEEKSSPLRNYVIHVLSQFDSEPIVIAPIVPIKDSLAGSVIESLSQREVEVLQLMALGNTNREIAQQYVISPGTVKAHTSSIYRKLNVANRTEAVARARQLGILS